MNTRRYLPLLAPALFTGSISALPQLIDFTPQTPARAAEVNSNFQFVEGRANSALDRATAIDDALDIRSGKLATLRVEDPDSGTAFGFASFDPSGEGGPQLIGFWNGAGTGPQVRYDSGPGTPFFDIGLTGNDGDFTIEENDTPRLTVRRGGVVVVGDAPSGTVEHKLVVKNANGSQALRVLGPIGSVQAGGRINFGDANLCYIDEPSDDRMELRATGGVTVLDSFNVVGSKNFLQPHPTDASRAIRFAALEGNESGTYFRGTAQLHGGTAVIEVPEDFRLATEAEGLTVQVTPLGPGADLWVQSRSLDGVVVHGARDVAFDYQVNGVRRGFAGDPTLVTNHAIRPRTAGVPFAANMPPAYRQILVENGTLNADFTPNETTAAALGWSLAAPTQADLAKAHSASTATGH